MTDRDPLATIIRRQRRDVRLLYRTLADSVRAAVGREDAPQRAVTEADRVRIMRAVDEGLGVIWGRYHGDEDAAMRHIILRDTAAARYRPLDAAVRDWRRALPATVRERIEEEAM